MIEDLTAEKLKEYGFDESSIERIMTWDNYKGQSRNNRGNFFVSKLENKIYSGTHYYEKSGNRMMFEECKRNFENYFNINCKINTKKKKEKQGDTFNEVRSWKRFKEKEIKTTNIIIELYENEPPKHLKNVEEKLDDWRDYLDWLDGIVEPENIKQKETDYKEWESFINPLVKSSFLETEKQATAGTGKFDRAIRCAAFCEMIYYGKALLGKPFMIQTKTPVITMADFALSRYEHKIKPSLGGGDKKAARLEHQRNTKNSLPPLKNSF